MTRRTTAKLAPSEHGGRRATVATEPIREKFQTKSRDQTMPRSGRHAHNPAKAHAVGWFARINFCFTNC